MASPPTSKLSFRDENENRIDAPAEWVRGYIEIDHSVDEWEDLELHRNGASLPIFVKRLDGTPKILAEWPLSGAGAFELTLTHAGGSFRHSEICSIQPRKLTPGAVEHMLADLQRRLPASIAVALQRGGALAGIDIVAPRETTLAEELNRIRRAINGTPGRQGLADVLSLLAGRPHHILHPYERWTSRERARRIDPTRLPQALQRAGNLDQDRLPILVPERPVEHSVDVYENRIIKAFHDQVNLRLRALIPALRRDNATPQIADAEAALMTLRRARRAAGFLDDVTDLTEPPARVTMVLLKRSEYRVALEGFLEFRRRALVQLREPAIDAPLENLPHLYETWGVLQVIAALLEVAVPMGYRVRLERLSVRRPGELWIRLLKGGQPAVVLVHPESQTVVKLIPQRTYGTAGTGLRSVSFPQRPDVAVEVTQGARTRIFIFDPKYKLRSEDIAEEVPTGKPMKPDIDAMHSYRDSIRDEAGRRAVHYAAILYPGASQDYTPGLAALSARPDDAAPLRASVEEVLTEAIGIGASVSGPTVQRALSNA